MGRSCGPGNLPIAPGQFLAFSDLRAILMGLDRTEAEMKFLRDPLIHFLVLGALLVGLRSLFVSVPLETTPSPVFVDAVVVARLERDWSRSTGGPPTAGTWVTSCCVP